MNIQDEIRDVLMRVLYDIHTQSRSPASIAKGIREITQIVQEKFTCKQQEISHNLDYIIQKGWVIKETIEKSFTTKDGMNINNPQFKYKISDIGIDKYEEASTFHSTKHHPTVNITNINGVTVVGNGNIVNSTYTKLMSELVNLKTALDKSKNISDTQKLEAIADIESIQSQLEKPHPNVSVIKTLFTPLEKVATVAGVYSAYQIVLELIKPLIS